MATSDDAIGGRSVGSVEEFAVASECPGCLEVEGGNRILCRSFYSELRLKPW